MIKDNLKALAYPSEVEKKIKFFLTNKLDYCSFEDAYYYLIYKNNILQTAYKISDEEFNKILFKNYILIQNSSCQKTSMLELTYQDQFILKIFNKYIEDNDLYSAYELFNKNFSIYEFLCLSYIRNLKENNSLIIEQIPKNRLNKVYNKIFLLKQMQLNPKIKKLTK